MTLIEATAPVEAPDAAVVSTLAEAPADKPHHAIRLLAMFRSRSARIGVLGLGYVGLPMALEFARAGFCVTGFEVDERRVADLKAGRSYINDVTAEQVLASQRGDQFHPTADFGLLGQMDAILICVPTPLRKSRDPDLTAVLAASRAVAEHVRPGQLIVLESTTYPGTTEEVLLPMFTSGGLDAGEDIFVAFSPERVDPANGRYGVADIPKLVGACSPAGSEVAAELYRQIVSRVVVVSSTRVAEAAKLLENTFRSVNIALANEMAIVCRSLGVDVWEVIDAAATKPFGFMAHYPGPGIGGHCIPLDPHYLAWKARLSGYEPRFISLASEINGAMPHQVVDMVTSGLNDMGRCVRGSRILLLGVAYKPNVSDVRESPALEITDLLEKRGAWLSYCDPYVEEFRVGESVIEPVALTPETLREQECVLVITNHRDFDYEMVARESPLVVDTRNATRKWAGLGRVRFL